MMNLYHVYSKEYGDTGDLLIRSMDARRAILKATTHITKRCKCPAKADEFEANYVNFEDGIIEMRDV